MKFVINRPHLKALQSCHWSLEIYKHYSCRNNQDVLSKHSAIVQVSTACVQTLSHPQFSHQEDIATKEKLLLQTLGEDPDQVVWKQMLNLMAEELDREK